MLRANSGGYSLYDTSPLDLLQCHYVKVLAGPMWEGQLVWRSHIGCRHGPVGDFSNCDDDGKNRPPEVASHILSSAAPRSERIKLVELG